MEQQSLSETPAPKRAKMVGWYNPTMLISTAIRVAISTVFGEFADRREAMAAARPISPKEIDETYVYGHKEDGDFWFDFMADTGDGWNSTYAIARLLAAPSLTCGGATEPLQRGRILIMGGDQVYPTASRADYEVKLIGPFDEAARRSPIPSKTDVYAIPGNHDWYDGLSAFLGQFCRRRNGDTWAKPRRGKEFGGRETQQTRSYFALSLPGDWWLWGADVQLSGYIDQPQVDFFEHVAREWMQEGSKLILCTGQPIWTGVDIDNPAPTFKNFSYLESIATRDEKRHRLCVVLTGDSHHYSRYVEDDRHYITAGGGGAFLHPTHHLADKCFDWEHPAPGKPHVAGQKDYPRSFKLARDPVTNEPVTFPDEGTSKTLSFRNLAFALLNPQYTFTLGCACALYMWMLHANAKLLGGTLIELLSAQTGLCAIAATYFRIVFASPWPVILAGVVGGAYYYLADFSPTWRRGIVGVTHAVCQFGVVMAATCLLACCAGLPSDGWLIILSGIVGGVLAGTMLGTYFLICLNVFGKHWNEAFSALRIEDYKCFLRLKIDRQGRLSIYPIGLKTVPRDDGAELRDPSLREHLIEGPLVL
ncbi:metallophosphoesterase family protein [Pararhizobium sp. O133]|uniref:metallophosphoesterase family protein n=1 Tax=Pararhizobium sp. O133 TaxID=3449278 RepID=UPI003F683469